MANVNDAINELIEESYLMGLSEQEIRSDFEQFIETCFNVIKETVKDREAVNGLAESLAREKTVILIADHPGSSGTEPVNDEDKSSDAVFAERVARRKRLILKTIAQYDPDLVRLIDEQRFQGKIEDEVSRPKFKIRKGTDWEQVSMSALKVGYAATIGLVALLILGFLQRS